MFLLFTSDSDAGKPPADFEFNVWTKPDCAGTPYENANRQVVAVFRIECKNVKLKKSVTVVRMTPYQYEKLIRHWYSNRFQVVCFVKYIFVCMHK